MSFEKNQYQSKGFEFFGEKGRDIGKLIFQIFRKCKSFPGFLSTPKKQMLCSQKGGVYVI